jgi:hypothetical protein
MPNVTGNSADAAVPAVAGTNTAPAGVGVKGISDGGWGVHGISKSGRGVVAHSDADYALRAHSKASAGIRASSDEGRGVEGWSTKAEGVHGISQTGSGVWGYTKAGTGVVGSSDSGIGVVGDSTGNEGVRGVSRSAHGGVVGINEAGGPGGNGGWFESTRGEGLRGTSKNVNHGGVVGVNTAGGIAVFGTSDRGGAFHGETRSTAAAAITAVQLNGASDSAALHARHAGGRTAAFFEGNVVVTGDIALTGADFAEEFPLAAGASPQPGSVVVLDDAGDLRESTDAYDRRVTGIVSGAGSYRPGLVLDRQQSEDARGVVALVGKAYCFVDADQAPIGVGDLLTTSATPGHAMRATDPARAFGAVIGKALRPLSSGRGLIPVLVALQ